MGYDDFGNWCGDGGGLWVTSAEMNRLGAIRAQQMMMRYAAIQALASSAVAMAMANLDGDYYRYSEQSDAQLLTDAIGFVEKLREKGEKASDSSESNPS